MLNTDPWGILKYAGGGGAGGQKYIQLTFGIGDISRLNYAEQVLSRLSDHARKTDQSPANNSGIMRLNRFRIENKQTCQAVFN